MNEKQLIEDARSLGLWERHKFLALVGITILISLFLVGVALSLYASSGAAQLDLSRPGYQSVRDQTIKTDDFDSFDASGPINEESLSQFRSLYGEQAKEASAIDSFGGKVMSDKALSIDAPSK